MLRGAAKRNAEKTHCKRGHEFTEANTIWFAQNGKERGGRVCRTCKNWWHRRRWPKVRDQKNEAKRRKRREDTLKREGVL